MRIRNIKKNREKKGFTLIEVITVLFVISLGMVGVLSLIVQNIKSQSLNKNTLIAYQLAQEGVELIRQVRDSNWLKGESWRHELDRDIYYMDYLDNVPHEVLSMGHNHYQGALEPDANGFYRNAPPSSKTSIFSRLIQLGVRNNGIIVTSRVYWTDHGREYVYSLEAMLYDWK